ncbi:hypothetical protein K402DRAFT_399991 [Aulographum hederae CBS 113979]|uniref:Uncharacterized protein n=1 Tax=Aulographum hederae CBS 113979 TaxID=1176131 RepID=A0A6G1HGB3_9PEZI|nr:hypothetical protein K402DRAFT_399991 [Aulographum hederae CBS 113979]
MAAPYQPHHTFALGDADEKAWNWYELACDLVKDIELNGQNNTNLDFLKQWLLDHADEYDATDKSHLPMEPLEQFTYKFLNHAFFLGALPKLSIRWDPDGVKAKKNGRTTTSKNKFGEIIIRLTPVTVKNERAKLRNGVRPELCHILGVLAHEAAHAFFSQWTERPPARTRYKFPYFTATVLDDVVKSGTGGHGRAYFHLTNAINKSAKAHIPPELLTLIPLVPVPNVHAEIKDHFQLLKCYPSGCLRSMAYGMDIITDIGPDHSGLKRRVMLSVYQTVLRWVYGLDEYPDEIGTVIHKLSGWAFLQDAKDNPDLYIKGPNEGKQWVEVDFGTHRLEIDLHRYGIPNIKLLAMLLFLDGAMAASQLYQTYSIKGSEVLPVVMYTLNECSRVGPAGVDIYLEELSVKLDDLFCSQPLPSWDKGRMLDNLGLKQRFVHQVQEGEKPTLETSMLEFFKQCILLAAPNMRPVLVPFSEARTNKWIAGFVVDESGVSYNPAKYEFPKDDRVDIDHEVLEDLMFRKRYPSGWVFPDDADNKGKKRKRAPSTTAAKEAEAKAAYPTPQKSMGKRQKREESPPVAAMAKMELRSGTKVGTPPAAAVGSPSRSEKSKAGGDKPKNPIPLRPLPPQLKMRYIDKPKENQHTQILARFSLYQAHGPANVKYDVKAPGSSTQKDDYIITTQPEIQTRRLSPAEVPKYSILGAPSKYLVAEYHHFFFVFHLIEAIGARNLKLWQRKRLLCPPNCCLMEPSPRDGVEHELIGGPCSFGSHCVRLTHISPGARYSGKLEHRFDRVAHGFFSNPEGGLQ